MKKVFKILFIICIVIGIFYIAAFIFIKKFSKSGLPDYNASVEIEGLNSEVQVFRDSFGIPHIYAQNEEDLYKVTGYISAQDRMWQMDLLRRVTQGRLSEIFGDSYIDADVLLRSLRIPEKSELVLSQTEPEIIKLIEAFAVGVNQYLSDYEDNMPFEFRVLGYKPEKWEIRHSVNLVGYMAWNLEMGWGTESIIYKLKNALPEDRFKEFLPDLSIQETSVYPPLLKDIELKDSSLISSVKKINALAPEVFRASNNWVISGEKSETGKPIFANDMHLGLMIPGIWSQIHQHVKGKLDVTGVILPGQPFIVCGHNENIAWGMTNVMLDGADFYVETINPEDENQYRYNGEWKDIQIRNEKIFIKGKEEPVDRVLKFTHRGPVISDIKNINDKSVSMHWVGNEFSNELRTVYLLNRAKNWEEFREAVKTFKAISQNIAYADIEGNIGLQCCAGVPIRTAPGNMYYPGDTDTYDWKGMVEFDSLPFVYNPEEGFAFSANNKTTDKSFQYYISSWFDLPNRAERIKSLLTDKEKLSIQDFKQIQNDQTSVLALNFKPIIIKHLEAYGDFSEEEKKAFEMIKNWDCNYKPDEPSPLIFETFYMVLAENIISDEMSDSLYTEYLNMDLLTNYLMDKVIKNEGSILCDDLKTEKVETLKDMILISFKECVKSFKEAYGKSITDINWGDLHKLTLKQPIGENGMMDLISRLLFTPLNRTYSVGGSYHTVSPYSYDFNNPYNSKHGASHRHIYDLSNFNNSQTIIPTGVSGIPGSEHYCDQSDMYVNGKYHIDYFSFDKVKENLRYETTFKPKRH